MPIQRQESLIIHEPTTPVKACIIWLHGLGASGDDFIDMPDFFPAEDEGIRMLFPNAPAQPVTINMGMKMPAWYDIRELNADLVNRSDDAEGIARSRAQIDALVDAQIAQGVDSQHIFLFGFSQGGAMAIHTGTHYAKPLGGIVGLSCYLLNPKSHTEHRHEANLNTPIWMAHGSQDPVVSVEYGRESAAILEQAGHRVTWTEYPMEHTLCLPEIQALVGWTVQRLKSIAS